MKKRHAAQTVVGLPVVGLLLDDPRLAVRYAWGAEAKGWRVARIAPAAAGVSLDPAPRLLVADADRLTTFETVRRVIGDATGLVAVGSTVAVPRADDILDIRAPEEAIDALFVRWRPVSLPASARRQIETFGVAAMKPLLASLRARLAAAVSHYDAIAPDTAHRIAGLAGILGFAELAAAWEDFAHDGEPANRDVYRLARLAIGALDEDAGDDGADQALV